jgi:hypothetical protein
MQLAGELDLMRRDFRGRERNLLQRSAISATNLRSLGLAADYAECRRGSGACSGVAAGEQRGSDIVVCTALGCGDGYTSNGPSR